MNYKHFLGKLPYLGPKALTSDLEAPLAEKAFDEDWLLRDLELLGATVAIPHKANRKIHRDHDAEACKQLNLGENYLQRLKSVEGYPQDPTKLIAVI